MRILVALVALLVLAPAAEAKRPPCSKGGETVAANRLVRVFERGDALRACSKSDRRRIVLARAYDDEYVSSASYGDVVLAGSFVAWTNEAYDISCKAACPPGHEPSRVWVAIRDVATGDERTAPAAAPRELVLTYTGSAAWLDGGEVRALEDAGPRLLDAGDVSALEASRTRVSWRNGADVRVAQLG